jgi:LEA14-like dessication related protein
MIDTERKTLIRSLSRRTAAFSLAALALGGGGLLSSCAVLPKFEKPILSVVGISLGRSDLLQQTLVLHLRVENPNNLALPVKGLQYRLELNGEEFARGETSDSFSVPAGGASNFDTSVTTNLAGAVLRLASSRGKNVNYKLSGTVLLSSGLLPSVTFERVGAINLL